MYLDATPIQKETRNSLFTSFLGCIFEREMDFIKREDFIPGEHHCLCSQHFHGAKKHGRSDVPIIFPLLSQSKQRKPPKIHLPLEPPARRKKIRIGKSKALVDAVVEEKDFCVDLSVPMKIHA